MVNISSPLELRNEANKMCPFFGRKTKSCLQICWKVHSTYIRKNTHTHTPYTTILMPMLSLIPVTRTNLFFSDFLFQDKEADGAEELGMPNVGGIYVVLFIGCVAATCFGILEWICHIYSTSRQYKVPNDMDALFFCTFVYHSSCILFFVSFLSSSPLTSSLCVTLWQRY